MGSKMKKPTHTFRETNLVPQPIWESRNKRKTDDLVLAKEKKNIFCNIYFVQRKCVQHLHLYFISMYRVLNKLSDYIYFWISKNITLQYLYLKSSKALSISLNKHAPIKNRYVRLMSSSICR